MTLTELRYIVALAHEKHFSKAAARCFVSQPTLSVAIHKLEETLNLKLFERNKQEVRLTLIGAKIVEQAQRVLDEVDSLKNIAKQGQDELKGTLRIGAIYTIGPYLFPSLIPQLHSIAPDMPLIIEENFTATLRERLIQGDLDIIFISLPFTGKGIQTRTLYREEFVWVLPADHPLSKHKQIAPVDLQNENIMLLSQGHCFREQVLSVCPQCAQMPEDKVVDTIEGSSLETVRLMVASGMGITVLPKLASSPLYHQPNTVAIRPFSPTVPTREVAVAWRQSFPRPKVIDCIQKAVQEIKLEGIELI